jgi:hypothetical protein
MRLQHLTLRMRLQRKIRREDELSAANFEMERSGSVYAFFRRICRRTL